MSESASQSTQLINNLQRDLLDCMICMIKIRRNHPIWSCPVCYNIIHLDCVRKWAASSMDDNGWRCPGCQTYSTVIPTTYTCFCGKTKNPSYANRYDVTLPHCCTKGCGRKGSGGPDCNHQCQSLCHPGKCNPCHAQVTRHCGCGRQKFHVACSSTAVLLCGNVCGKFKNCGLHICENKCHEHACEPCSTSSVIDCFCGKHSKTVLCSMESRGQYGYSCGEQCERLLTCNNHKCTAVCHAYCLPCSSSPSMVLSCPCGQTPIDDACKLNGISKRKSCKDPIPTCGKICLKILNCGSSEEKHRCQFFCHSEQSCPPCPLTTLVKCRCGNKQSEIPCKELEATGEILCEKKCTKKRSCGKHKCNSRCCIDVDHICPAVCGRNLGCANHKCELLCHNGHCPPCRVASFEELTCECGAAVIYPPVPCGTKWPDCTKPCGRQHNCEHPVHHPCSREPCPPCYVLTAKWCFGKHMRRQNIPCHIEEVSCGLPCLKPLPCKMHKCPKKCHPKIGLNGCMNPDETCKLPCVVLRKNCYHPCNAECHTGYCPDTKCKEMVEIVCMCGRLKDSIVCWKREAEYDKIMTQALGQKIEQLKLENTWDEVNEEQLTADFKASRGKSQLLKCDKECARIERNKKLAEALQLENPDITTQLGAPNYSDYMKKMAQKNPRFVESVHEKLTALVMKAKEMKKGQKNLTFQFESLNRDKRQLIYEYCEHFGCAYNSIDEGEPGLKSAIITAAKDRCWLPAVGLVASVFQQTVRAERKTAYADVELSQSKSQILGPANLSNLKKLETPKTRSEGMVLLKNPE